MEEVLQMFLQYGYLVLVVGMFIDALGIPFPGDLLLLAAGFLVSQGHFSLMLVLPLAIGAVLIGDSITFALGKAVCRAEGTFLYRLYCRWTKCTLASRDCFRRACGAFDSLGTKSIVVSKFMWGTREFIPPLAGLSGMNYRLFVGLDTLGIMLWVVTFLFVGYYFGSQAETIFGQVQDIVFTVGLAMAIGVSLIIGVRIAKRKKRGVLEPLTAIPDNVQAAPLKKSEGGRVSLRCQESERALLSRRCERVRQARSRKRSSVKAERQTPSPLHKELKLRTMIRSSTGKNHV